MTVPLSLPISLRLPDIAGHELMTAFRASPERRFLCAHFRFLLQCSMLRGDLLNLSKPKLNRDFAMYSSAQAFTHDYNKHLFIVIYFSDLAISLYRRPIDKRKRPADNLHHLARFE